MSTLVFDGNIGYDELKASVMDALNNPDFVHLEILNINSPDDDNDSQHYYYDLLQLLSKEHHSTWESVIYRDCRCSTMPLFKSTKLTFDTFYPTVLQVLSLTKNEKDNSFQEKESILATIKTLSIVDMYFSNCQEIQPLVSFLIALPCLETLAINKCRIENNEIINEADEIIHILSQSLSHCYSLLTLDLVECKLTDNQLHMMLLNLPIHVEHLLLGENRARELSMQVLADLISPPPPLPPDNNNKNETQRNIKTLKLNMQIELIDLDTMPDVLPVSALWNALNSPDCTLELLNLSANLIGDEGLIGLDLQHNKKLLTLRLMRNDITDYGICNYLAPVLANWSTLKNLYLNNNLIGDEGWKSLSLALEKSNTTLQEIHFMSVLGPTSIHYQKLEHYLQYNWGGRRLGFSSTLPTSTSKVVMVQTSLIPLILARAGRLENYKMSFVAGKRQMQAANVVYHLLRDGAVLHGVLR